jgi:hypothetical protein
MKALPKTWNLTGVNRDVNWNNNGEDVTPVLTPCLKTTARPSLPGKTIKLPQIKNG